MFYLPCCIQGHQTGHRPSRAGGYLGQSGSVCWLRLCVLHRRSLHRGVRQGPDWLPDRHDQLHWRYEWRLATQRSLTDSWRLAITQSRPDALKVLIPATTRSDHRDQTNWLTLATVLSCPAKLKVFGLVTKPCWPDLFEGIQTAYPAVMTSYMTGIQTAYQTITVSYIEGIKARYPPVTVRQRLAVVHFDQILKTELRRD